MSENIFLNSILPVTLIADSKLNECILCRIGIEGLLLEVSRPVAVEYYALPGLQAKQQKRAKITGFHWEAEAAELHQSSQQGCTPWTQPH